MINSGGKYSGSHGPSSAGYVAGIDITDQALAEVVGLHDFFSVWFRADLPATDEVYTRFADALHPAFSMVVTTGVVLDRGTVLGAVRSAHGSRPDAFHIAVRNFEARVTGDDALLATYEEWQFDGDELLTARTSTAYFVADPAAPEGVAWRHLHETLHPTG